MKTIGTISVIVLLLVCGFFLLKGCQQGKEVQAIADSLKVEKALNDTIKIANVTLSKKNDSVIATKKVEDSLYKHRIDSLSKRIASLEGNFSVARDSISTLYAKLKTDYLNHDTVALFASYDELRKQLTEANQLIFAIQINRDSSDFTRSAEITRLNGVINTLQAQINQYQGLLVECTNNGAALAKNGELAVKKAKAGRLFAEIGAGLAGLVAILLLVK